MDMYVYMIYIDIFISGYLMVHLYLKQIVEHLKNLEAHFSLESLSIFEHGGFP